MPGRDIRGDPRRAGRGRRCPATNGEQDIIIHWRGAKQACLVEVAPGKWEGPCPRCGRFRVLHVEVGDNGDVVWAVTGKCSHSREDVYPQLSAKVPCAPKPGAERQHDNAELGTLKDQLRGLVLNPNLNGKAKDLVLLQSLGMDTAAALDAIGITDKGYRSRIQMQARRGLALRPGKVDTGVNRRRSTREKAKKAPLPARVDESDNHPVDESVNHYSYESQPLTSENTELTEHATIVLPLGATDTHTSTDTRAVDLDLALDLLRTTLGAEVISTEPRPSPFPVADITEVWTASEAGPCRQCATATCLYGDRGSLFCADCRTSAGRRTG